MKTIEIQQINIKKNKLLIKRLITLLPKNAYYHFLYEPKLIIRMKEDKYIKAITDYLTRRKLKYRIYNYPFGKGYGEDKKSVVYKYKEEFIPILNIQSAIAIKRNRKDDIKIIERQTHTFLNTLGYEWIDESIILGWLSGGRMKAIKKYDTLSPIAYATCVVIIFIMKFNLFLMKSLK